MLQRNNSLQDTYEGDKHVHSKIDNGEEEFIVLPTTL